MKKRKILVLVSNPRGTPNLDLLPEISQLKEALRRSQNRNRFVVEWEVAVHQKDLYRLILDDKPQIVHFCGHGTEQGLVLEDDNGRAKVVSKEFVTSLLKDFADRIECVLLNACDSGNLADELAQHLNYVIGMSQEVRDDAALTFAEAFYDTLGAGESYERAFDIGKTAVLGMTSSRDTQSRKAEVVSKDGQPTKVQSREYLIPVLKINPNPKIIQIPDEDLAQEERTEIYLRKKLLAKVKDNWLYMLQRPSSKATIKLKLKTLSRLVKNPFSNEQDLISGLDVDTDIEGIFNRWHDGQRLLIVGDPGAGKTIALLQLAKKFYNAIAEDADRNVLEKPIPVVFHLSSWKCGQSLEEWLVQELSNKYGFPEQAENWVRNRKLFLFLDGFDWVEAEHQQSCAREIDKFGASDIVVCSRSKQYEALPEEVRLNIDLAVCLKPLTSIQINSYLETLDKLDLRQVLEKDKKLGELAKIPFWLKIITDVDERLPREGASEDRKKKLFDEYIKTRFNRADRLKYDKKKTIEWLSWLASRSESVFLIEEMQPSWLTRDQKKLYLGVLLFIGMLLGLLSGIPYGTIVYFFILYSQGSSHGFLGQGIVLGVAAGVIIGTAAQYFLKLHKRPIKTHKEVILSWQKAQSVARNTLEKSVRETIVVGGLVFLFVPFLLPKLYPVSSRLRMGLIVAAFFGLITLISRLVSDSLVESKQVKTLRPNQGILESRKTAFLVAKITSVVVATIDTSCSLILYHDQLNKLPVMLILGICVAVVTGGVAAFIHDSGRVCQQHFALRIVLYLTGDIPWNYENFLNYASESNKLNFLNRIGGGYQFFHGLFKQHLASLKPERMNG